MKLIGEKVQHISFGEGTIKEINEKKITVEFDMGEKNFDYPYVFDKFLALKNDGLLEIIQEKRAEIEEEKARVRLVAEIESRKEKQKREMAKQINRKGGVSKIIKDNIIFKCNFCDGSVERNEIGFKEASETESVVAYEGEILREWKGYAGVVQSGANKGKPKKIKKVKPNNLAVLTSKLPKAPEKDRFIFGVFIVNDIYEGEEMEEGYVEAHPEYKITLTKEESEKIKFWDYYFNENNPTKMQLTSGLHRYLSDEQSVQILRDIYKIKQGKPDEEIVKNTFERYCQYKGFDMDKIREPEGALKRS